MRSKDASVLKRLAEAREKHDVVLSIDSLKKGMDLTSINRLMKGMFD